MAGSPGWTSGWWESPLFAVELPVANQALDAFDAEEMKKTPEVPFSLACRRIAEAVQVGPRQRQAQVAKINTENQEVVFASAAHYRPVRSMASVIGRSVTFSTKPMIILVDFWRKSGQPPPDFLQRCYCLRINGLIFHQVG
jgi:hypothetical protein